MSPFVEVMAVPVASFVFVCVFVGVIVWLVLRSRQASLRMQAEFQKNLLDKFSSGQEFSAFLESKGGQKFLEESWMPRGRARQRVLPIIVLGVVFSTVGLGVLGLALFAQYHRGAISSAVVFLSLGVGFLISGFISNRLLKQRGESGESGSLHP